MKDNAEPTVAPPRKYPIQLKKEMQEKLDEMEKMDVIEKVTGPSEWVNQLAYARKKTTREIRVCLDPKDLNKQMKGIHPKALTLEEITHKFTGEKVFSKLDTKHGYWGILLQESSKKRAYNTQQSKREIQIQKTSIRHESEPGHIPAENGSNPVRSR